MINSLGSYLAKSYMDTKRQEVEEKRDKLNNKIKNLYAPITGNRILHESAIRAIEKHHSKQNHM